MRSRTGCFAGCVVVLALVLLYPLVLLAQILVPLALGVFFPWEPPVAEDAPEGAVLRVIAPEHETYRIVWGSGFSTATDEGETIDPELGYRDYPVRAAARDDFGNYNISVYAGDKDTYPTGNDEVSLGAVLFVSGKYAECRGGGGDIRPNWSPREGLDSQPKRILCASHRHARL
jgi:hypothetical protein